MEYLHFENKFKNILYIYNYTCLESPYFPLFIVDSSCADSVVRTLEVYPENGIREGKQLNIHFLVKTAIFLLKY